tara:strand:- start:217 stop:1227 length:1011 start_codon:yes stop_codon:yes gene_type:complete
MPSLPTLAAIRVGLPRMTTRRNSSAEPQELDRTGPDSALAICAAALHDCFPSRSPLPLQGTLDLEEVFRHYYEGRPSEAQHVIRSASGAFCSVDPIQRQESFLLDCVQAAMTEARPIIIYLDWLAYGVDSSVPRRQEQQAHASTLVLYPADAGRWGAFHFNPHGDFARRDHIYEQYRTRSRLRPMLLSQPLDAWVISQLVLCLSEQTGVAVEYAGNSAHNYMGPNLQAGDTIGLCYVFPFLLHYSIVSCPAALENITRGKGSSTVTKLACEWLGIPFAPELVNIRKTIQENAPLIGRFLPLMLARAVAGLKRSRSPSKSIGQLGQPLSCPGEGGSG